MQYNVLNGHDTYLCPSVHDQRPISIPNNEEKVKMSLPLCRIMGQDSAVGIATRYGLDGPGNRIPMGGARFSAPI